MTSNKLLEKSPSASSCQLVLATFLFCFINLLNYMNRFGTAQIVGRLKTAFQVDDTSLGLIPTGFELCFVVCSPLSGYLGDRFNRCYIIAASLLLSSISGMASSFVPESSFVSLVLIRSLLGITEAAYTNICPSIIGDLFVGKKRSLVLAIYQFSMPLGCGLGFICSGLAADIADDWRWAFRLTPLPMLVGAIFLAVFIREPERGEAENVVGLYETTSFKEDVSYLARIPSYVLTTFAFAGVAFSSNALLYWGPDLMRRMHVVKNSSPNESSSAVVLFGLIACIGGFVGVILGAITSAVLVKPRLGPASDGLVSGAGMIIGAPVTFLSAFIVTESFAACWCFLLLSIICFAVTFPLYSEITLNVVIATRRSTARSIQTTISHLLGDAASAYIGGKISDTIRLMNFGSGSSTTLNFAVADFTSLQWSMLAYTLVIALSGGLYLWASLFINKDADSISSYKPLKETKNNSDKFSDNL